MAQVVTPPAAVDDLGQATYRVLAADTSHAAAVRGCRLPSQVRSPRPVLRLPGHWGSTGRGGASGVGGCGSSSICSAFARTSPAGSSVVVSMQAVSICS